MAKKRMFSNAIIDSDEFLEMSLSAQCLYFHLNMRADDDGFVNNPKNIMKMVGAKEDDLKLLIVKKFLLLFESGVVVIKHWRIHNAIKYANYHETNYTEEKSKLYLKKNYSYTLDSNQGTALIKKREEKNIDEMRLDEKRLDENRLEENRIDKINDTYKDTDIVLDNDNELF